MGRYDGDDSEYVAYGSMSGGGSRESYGGPDRWFVLKEADGIFIEKYVKGNLSLDGKSASDIEKLAELLNKIYQEEELSLDDKKLMVDFGASEIILKSDVTYEDIKNLPEFKDLNDMFTNIPGMRDYISDFSAHRRIPWNFYTSMNKLASQDNDKSLYLRLTMMTKYKQFGYEPINNSLRQPLQYDNPKRRLYFIKTHLSSFKDRSLLSLIGGNYETLDKLLEGITPAEAKDILRDNILGVCKTRMDGTSLLGDKQKILPYVVETIKDPKTNGMVKEDLIDRMAEFVRQSHYYAWKDAQKVTYKQFTNPLTEAEKQFYDCIDDTLLQRADVAAKEGNSELLLQISEGIAERMDEGNPKTKELTDNQIAFYDKYFSELVKQLEFKPVTAYLDRASEDKRKLMLDTIKYAGNRYLYADYFKKNDICLYDADEFGRFVGTDELSKVVKEGFWIKSQERRVIAYNHICNSIYDASTPPLDEGNKPQIREIGAKLLQKLKKEHPLQKEDFLLNKHSLHLHNKTLLVLAYTGDTYDQKPFVENQENKIDETLLNNGVLKVSAKSQESESPVSKYCDVNEIWVDEELYGCKTNLLDRKLQRDAVKDVINLINRGADVSAKVERANRDGKKFPITPFDRYISGILYRNKSSVINRLGENMQRIATEIDKDKLPVMRKIFNSLSFKTRNDDRVKEIEKKVNQVVFSRNPNMFGKGGKTY